MQNSRPVQRFAVLIQLFVLTALSSALTAQPATHTILSDFGDRPDGASSAYTINLSMTPSDIDISGFSFIVAYDNTQSQLVSVSDNTGQPAAGVQYTIGSEQPLTGVPNVNVYVPVIMDTVSNLVNPTNLAQLNFVTTADYAEPNNRVWFYMDDHLEQGGLSDGDIQPVPTGYQASTPQEVPVSLSGFSIE